MWHASYSCLDKPMKQTKGGFPSGQRGQTVNLMAQPSQVRILHPPLVGFSVEGRHNMCRQVEIPAPSSTETRQAIAGQLVFIDNRRILKNKGDQGSRRV
jgi:hypothetical protein